MQVTNCKLIFKKAYIALENVSAVATPEESKNQQTVFRYTQFHLDKIYVWLSVHGSLVDEGLELSGYVGRAATPTRARRHSSESLTSMDSTS